MPAKITMNLSNTGNIHRMQFESLSRTLLAQVPVQKKSATLNSPMISRVHTARAGCGSCGH